MNLLCSDVKISIPDSLLVLLIGMVIIFSVLAILIGAVYAYVGVFKGMDKIKGKKSKNKKEEPKAETAANVNDEELAAAIAAAIAIVYASENEDGEVPPFKVKSIIEK